MAYVQPDGVCEFFGSLGLTANYDDSLYFPDHVTRDNYFSSLPKIATCNALTYSREQRGFIRVEQPMSIMIYASYMRFKNTSFENKWFYAFVKNVEYINNNCVQVNFEIDPLITWMGVFHLNECFIERQHTIGDAIGANIADEGLGTGEYVVEENEGTTYFQNYVIALFKAYNKTKDSGLIHYDYVQGIYNPLAIISPDLSSANATQMTDMIDAIVADNRSDEILCIKILPRHYANHSDVSPQVDTKNIAKPYNGSQAWGDFVPHNNKLYTYPYKYLCVINCEGDTCAYKYEYFNTLPDTESTGNCQFTFIGSATTPEANIMCIPTNYKHDAYRLEESITMKDFPSASFVVDSYKAYLAQRDSSSFGTLIADTASGAIAGGIAGGGAGAAAGAALGATRSAAVNTTLADSMNEGLRGASSALRSVFGQDSLLAGVLDSLTGGTIPPKVPYENRGTMSSNILVQNRIKDFYFRKMCITKNYAMMIDNFFDMFGYAIRQRAVPNMNARPHWTYVKTKGCSVDGALPADDAQAIENIFNKGVRFWKNHNEIGNYGYDNSPSA